MYSNNFSFKAFYIKRIRRLFPALIFTIIITLVVGYFILSPYDYKSLGESATWSSLSIANIYFWLESGYFDSSSIYKPLLHFWSLSLEEQFYLIWPLLLFLTYKFKRRFFLFFVFSFILSIGIALLLGRQYVSGNFFLLPSRVFEFVLGATCIVLENKTRGKSFFNYSGIIGLVLIICASVVYNSDTFMPSAKSLIPCIGAVFIILQNRDAVFNKLLDIKPLQIIGKTSYSIYLIHWPLIVYYKYTYSAELVFFEILLIVVSSISIGYLMWKYIENPFRNIKKNKKDYALFFAPIWVITLCAISFIIVINEGFVNRFPVMKNLLRADQIEFEKNRYLDNTFLEIEKVSDSFTNKNVIIMGNSHAKDLAYSLINNGFKANISFLPTSSHCYNFGSPRKEKYLKECEILKSKNLQNTSWSNADFIFLHDNWSILDLEDLNNFLNTIRELTNAPIYVFGPKLTFNRPALKIIHSSKYNTVKGINSYAKKFTNLDDRRLITEHLSAYINTSKFDKERIYFIDVLKIQCGEDYNETKVVSPNNTKLLYFDSEHFTLEGATEFGKKLKISHPELFELD